MPFTRHPRARSFLDRADERKRPRCPPAARDRLTDAAGTVEEMTFATHGTPGADE